jgi:His-Xaa-Ser system protein HxsD
LNDEIAREQAAPLEVRFDAASASVDAVQRAAYRFSDRFACELVTGEREYRCLLTVVGEEAVEPLVADFRTEVLDQVLRERIRAETEPIRTMILAHAFSRTGLAEAQDQN